MTIAIESGYDLWSESYDHEQNFLVDLEAQNGLIRDQVIHRFLTNRKSALDLGVGTGRHLACIEQYFDQTMGIDLSQRMLSVARSKVSKPNTILLRGDFLKSQFCDKFDFINSSLNYMHFRDENLLFSRVYSALRPGGILYLIDACQGFLAQGSTPNFEYRGKNITVDHVVRAMDRSAGALKKCGLELIQSGIVKYDPSLEQLAAKYRRYSGLDCLQYIVARRSAD